MVNIRCLLCDFYDPDFECVCPSTDIVYACLLRPKPSAEDFTTKEESDYDDDGRW